MREAIDREDAPARRGRLAHLARRLRRPGDRPGIDTRALVRHIRDKGAMRGGVFPGDDAEAEARELVDGRAADGGPDLAREVTPAEPVILDPDNRAAR